MKPPVLGRLTRVDLREVWSHEAHSFTPWLAEADNLAELATALDLPGLELVETEQTVEEFSADIVARIPETGETVVIENQLEDSDHKHLGQLLTYAAGTEAVAIVWVTSRFKNGHRAVLDWLNRSTIDELGFFAVEVEAWRIGDSVPAPKFNVTVRPNEWARTMRNAVRSKGMSPDNAANIEYWSEFHAHAVSNGAPHRPSGDSIKGQVYYVYPIAGMNWVYFAASISRGARLKSIELKLCLAAGMAGPNFDVPAIYRRLYAKRDEIGAEIGFELDWRERPGPVFHIGATLPDADPDDQDDWPRQHEWLAARLKDLDRVFAERVKALASEAGKDEEG